MKGSSKHQIVSLNELMAMNDEIWKIDDIDSKIFEEFSNKVTRSSFIKNAEDVVQIHSKLLIAKMAGFIDGNSRTQGFGVFELNILEKADFVYISDFYPGLVNGPD